MRLRFRLRTYILAVYVAGPILALSMTVLSRYLEDRYLADSELDQALPPRSGYIELFPVFSDQPYQTVSSPAAESP